VRRLTGLVISAVLVLGGCNGDAGDDVVEDVPIDAVPSASCGPETETTLPPNGHLADGQGFTYPDFPPSGGPHDVRSLPAGVYSVPFGDEPAGSSIPSYVQAMHSLEHGYVIIYHSGGADGTTLAERYGTEPKVIIVPAGRAMDSPIALVSWARRRFCTAIDHAAIEDFIADHRARPPAPEPNGG
jgi:hypothetical protein